MIARMPSGQDFPKDLQYVNDGHALLLKLASEERLYQGRYLILDRYCTERNNIFLLLDTTQELPNEYLPSKRTWIYPYRVAIETLLDDPEVVKTPKWIESEITMGKMTMEEAKEEYITRLKKYTEAKISETGFIDRVDDIKAPDKPTTTNDTEESFGSF